MMEGVVAATPAQRAIEAIIARAFFRPLGEFSAIIVREFSRVASPRKLRCSTGAVKDAPDGPLRGFMSEQELDLTPVTERTDYPPILNAAVPALMLVVSIAYAWSLRGIVNAEMNLLLLRPLFVAVWVLLLIVIVKDVVPSIRLHLERSRHAERRSISWSERFAPGTEAGAGLVVFATLLFSIFGPGDGPRIYIACAFAYLALVGYVIGERNWVWLIPQAAILSIGLYLIMGWFLGVRL
jgi:hypothetical protein